MDSILCARGYDCFIDCLLCARGYGFSMDSLICARGYGCSMDSLLCARGYDRFIDCLLCARGYVFSKDSLLCARGYGCSNIEYFFHNRVYLKTFDIAMRSFLARIQTFYNRRCIKSHYAAMLFLSSSYITNLTICLNL